MNLEDSKNTLKMFQFNKIKNNEDESVGVGVGLSTADSLARALGGKI